MRLEWKPRICPSGSFSPTRFLSVAHPRIEERACVDLKLVQLLKEAVPGLSRLAVIWDETGTRRMGVDAVARDAAGGVGGTEES